MRYSIKGGSPEKISADCIIVIVWRNGSLSEEAKLIDSAGSKCISKITRAGDLSGKLGETQLIHNPIGIQAKRVLLVGGGEKKNFTASNAVKMLKNCLKTTGKLKATSLHFALASAVVGDRESTWLAARLAQEAEDSIYRYNTTKSKKNKAPATRMVSLAPAIGARRKNFESALKVGQTIGKAINYAKQLGNLPGNICTPNYLAKETKALAERHGTLTAQVLLSLIHI